MALCVCAGEFAPPAVGPVAFRRDRIPLNADAMAGLSQNLETLARALPGETAAERQAAARMLALAMALDPANARARELLAAYQNGARKPEPDAGQLGKSLARIWQLVAWLETPEAGENGQALAACLKDVLVISDPRHPRAAALREDGEKGAWAGWVAGIDAYGAEKTATPHETEIQPAAAEPAAESKVLLNKAQVHTILWRRGLEDESAEWTLAPLPLQMVVTTGEESSFPITIGSGEELAPLARTLEKLLAAQFDPLPRSARIRITSREFEQSLQSGKRQSISAAAAVLASAAVTGREPEAIIIGQVDESGAFNLPTGFWDQLQALGPGSGRRLVLPAAAADWLPSVLAMENPGVFMGYEVLLAEDFRHLLDLSAKTPDGDVAAATAKFREIRERAGSHDIRSYLANRFVRQRLDELAQSAPFHASAAMLLTQAKGNRPTLVKREVLAAELRRATQPMAWIMKFTDQDFSDEEIKKLGETHDLCRARVDRMERYAAKTDLDLLERARAAAIALRNLDRVARARGEDWLVRESVRSSRADFIRLYGELAGELAAESGEGAHFPAP
jgi:hypothetical protein